MRGLWCVCVCVCVMCKINGMYFALLQYLASTQCIYSEFTMCLAIWPSMDHCHSRTGNILFWIWWGSTKQCKLMFSCVICTCWLKIEHLIRFVDRRYGWLLICQMSICVYSIVTGTRKDMHAESVWVIALNWRRPHFSCLSSIYRGNFQTGEKSVS